MENIQLSGPLHRLVRLPCMLSTMSDLHSGTLEHLRLARHSLSLGSVSLPAAQRISVHDQFLFISDGTVAFSRHAYLDALL